MSGEHIFDTRGIVAEGIVLAVDDTGQVQTVDVMCWDGAIYQGVAVHQPAGFASMPQEGAVALLLAVGGDPSNLRALVPAEPGARFGKLAAGDKVIYAPDGTRVAVRQGGTIEILSATRVAMKVGSSTAVLTAGTLTLTSCDVIADGISLKHHTHSDPQGGTVGPPA